MYPDVINCENRLWKKDFFTFIEKTKLFGLWKHRFKKFAEFAFFQRVWKTFWKVHSFGQFFEMLSTCWSTQNTPKTSVLKMRRICIFPKGLVHGFGHKFEILSSCRLTQDTPKKSISWRSLRKQVFLENWNMDLKKPQNWRLLKVFTPWFWSKRWRFFIF